MTVDFNQAEISSIIELIEGAICDGCADEELGAAFQKLKEAEELDDE
ncbi:hypothetical protein [Lonsdalea quercina]